MNTRTNSVLDHELLARVMARSNVKTKKAAVAVALRSAVRKSDYARLLALRGQGVIDRDYDSRAPYGLTEAALERRGWKTFNDARIVLATQVGSLEKSVEKAKSPVIASGYAKRKQRAFGCPD